MTALIALAVLLALLFAAPPAVVQLAVALMVIGGAWEWSGFLGLRQSILRVLYIGLIALLLLLVHASSASVTDGVLMAAFAWWVFAGLWVVVYPTPVPVVLKWLGGVFILVPLFIALLDLYGRGAEVLLFLLLIVWSADVGAFFAGKTLGRVKLKPSISPGKTWEGVVGGLVFSSTVAVCGSLWFEADMLALVPFCIAIAMLSVVGDLTVSIFKRSAGVKDSGKLFPGHGGVLDRVDSVAAASPLFALGLMRLGLI